MINWNQNRGDEGFTLVEVLVAVTVLVAVSAGIYGLLMTVMGGFKEGEIQASVQQRNQLVAKMLNQELHYARNISVLDRSLEQLQSNGNLQTNDFSYIGTEDGQVVIYNQIPLDLPDMEDRRVITDTPFNSNNGKQNHPYQLKFSNDDGLVNYIIEVNGTEFDSRLESSIYPVNVGENETIEVPDSGSGQVIRYEPASVDTDSFLAGLGFNLFWREFISASDAGTLTSIGGYDWDTTTDSGELAVGIDGSGAGASGSLLLKKLEDEHFENDSKDSSSTPSPPTKEEDIITADEDPENYKGNIDSFSIIIDAKVKNRSTQGYGVLLRGTYESSTGDYGYMFQFDPGANGFVMRKIHHNWHVALPYVGAHQISDAHPNAIPNPKYYAPYTAAEIENASFNWDSGDYTYNKSDPSWTDRYKTVIKVQTQKQKNDELIVRVKVIDEKGNKSNEMWFGNFGKLKLNGSKYLGGNHDGSGFDSNKGLDWDYFHQKVDGTRGTTKTLPGSYVGIRTWGNAFDVKFYEMIIGGAEPAVKNVIQSDKHTDIELVFDEELYFSSGLVKLGNNLDKSDFEIYDSSGAKVAINDISLVNSSQSLLIKTSTNINNGQLKYKVPDSKMKSLFDDQGNQVHDFTVDLGINGLVQN